jgi:thiosulfate/3-mercaptopyruvate sulfurtransferase
VTGDELALLLSGDDIQLVDVRSPGEFDGSAGYPCDPVQGHIPGAVNIEVEEIAAAGSGVPALLQQHGVDPGGRIVCYCHSGGRSAYAVAALISAGVPAENYEGSWHEWSRRDAGPA